MTQGHMVSGTSHLSQISMGGIPTDLGASHPHHGQGLGWDMVEVGRPESP